MNTIARLASLALVLASGALGCAATAEEPTTESPVEDPAAQGSAEQPLLSCPQACLQSKLACYKRTTNYQYCDDRQDACLENCNL